MDVIDRIQRITQYLNGRGIEIRYEDLNGVPSGLCRVHGKLLLMVELTLPSTEQFHILEETANRLKSSSSRSVA